MARRIEKYSKDHVGLAWNFQVNPNSCGNPSHYENYLRLNAITDKNDGAGLTYILLDDEPRKRICGFITLRASSITEQYADHTIGNAAVEITELAVDKDFEHQGIGTILLSLAIRIATMINDDYVSVKYIALCADSQAVPFYEKFGFHLLKEYGDIPRDGWNNDCTPMCLRLPTDQ